MLRLDNLNRVFIPFSVLFQKNGIEMRKFNFTLLT